MSRPLRTVLRGFVAATIAFLFAWPFIAQPRCEKAGGRYDRLSLTCTLPGHGIAESPGRG